MTYPLCYSAPLENNTLSFHGTQSVNIETYQSNFQQVNSLLFILFKFKTISEPGKWTIHPLNTHPRHSLNHTVITLRQGLLLVCIISCKKLKLFSCSFKWVKKFHRKFRSPGSSFDCICLKVVCPIVMFKLVLWLLFTRLKYFSLNALIF